jgi:hypothetical protein
MWENYSADDHIGGQTTAWLTAAHPDDSHRYHCQLRRRQRAQRLAALERAGKRRLAHARQH